VAFFVAFNHGSSKAPFRPGKCGAPASCFAKMARCGMRSANNNTPHCPETICRNVLMDTTLTGEANILVCPNLDAANLFNRAEGHWR
jgi:malate dehydrogenase (oxaloacetate-decarboxylating)(NADP+)